MKRRSRKDYPEGDLTPEHSRRYTPDEKSIHPDVQAAYDYVESIRETSDYKDSLAWHGWALREAFLAGITYSEKPQQRQVAPTDNGIEELDEICESFNAGKINLTQLVCTAWNKALKADKARGGE